MVINPLVSQSPWGTGQQALWNTISRKTTMKITTNKNICKQNENKLFYYYYYHSDPTSVKNPRGP